MNGYEWATVGDQVTRDTLHYEGVKVKPEVAVQAQWMGTPPGLAPRLEWVVDVEGFDNERWGSRDSARLRAMQIAEQRGIIDPTDIDYEI